MTCRFLPGLAAAALGLCSCTGTVDQSSGGSDSDDPVAAPVTRGPAVGRRLTRTEYFNAIEVALDVALEASDFDLPRDNRIPQGFRNSAAEMLLSPARIAAYDAIATAAAEAADMQRLIADHAPCSDPTAECIDGFLRSLGVTLLRAPLPDIEVAAFAPLFAAALDEGGTFEDGARLAVRAMLQSPRFVYRLEKRAGGTSDMVEIDDYELATRASFLVWNGPPDRELLDAAAAGNLRANLGEQVDRMLDHPRAQRAFRQYLEQWLYLDAIPDTFPLQADLKNETYRLFESIAWEQEGALMDAFTAQRTYLSPALAEFYGLTPAGEGTREYSLADVPERIGFLTHAGLLTARTVNPQSSMIDRGLFVLNDLFCESVPPPEGTELEEAIEEQMIPETSGLSQRERFARQRENPLCATCHGVIDPLGLAFETFDRAGRFIAEDEFGNELTGSGQLDFGDVQASYADVGEFAAALGRSRTVARCLSAKSLQHAWGRYLTAQDAATVDAVYETFDAGGGTYRALVRAIAAHPDFDKVEAAP